MYYKVKSIPKNDRLCLGTSNRNAIKSLKHARKFAQHILQEYNGFYAGVQIYGFSELWHTVGADEQQRERAIYSELINQQ